MFRRTVALSKLLSRHGMEVTNRCELAICTLPSTSSGVRSLYTVPVRLAAVAEQKVDTVVPKVRKQRVKKAEGGEKQIKKGEREWEKHLLDTLQKELLEENKRYSQQQGKRQEHGLLIKYSMEGDGQSLVPLLLRHTMKSDRGRRIAKEDDEFLSVGLLLVAQHFTCNPYPKSSNDTFSPALFYSTTNLFDRLRKMGEDTAVAAIHLLIQIENWAALRPIDNHTEDINENVQRIENNMKKNIGYPCVSDSRCLLTSDERVSIRQRLEKLIEKTPRVQTTRVNSGYDENLHLVDSLRSPVPSESYHGNPFQLPYIDESQYLSRFSKHIALEQCTWMRVKNVCRPKDASPINAEQLIDGWKWRQSIENELKKKMEKMTSNAMRTYLGVVGVEETSKCVFESVVRILSQGQNLVPHAMFQADLTGPFLELVHRKFIRVLGIKEEELWSKVFADYSQIVCDPEVSRLHSHREWWMKCTRRHGLPPDLEMPFRQFPSSARVQLGVFLLDTVSHSCLFPSKSTRKGQKDGPAPAFSLRNVAIEEESAVSEEGTANVVKMVHIHPQLAELLQSHQFEHIIFPTSQLPMTIPPRPWIDNGVGGPEYTRKVDVVRRIVDFKRVDINREMKGRLKEEQARPVWDALNQLGCTPWTINQPMLDVLTEAFSMSSNASHGDLLDSLSVPRKSETVHIPNYAENFGTTPHTEIDKMKWREYAKSKAEAIKTKNEYNSLWCWMLYRIVLAHHFRRETLFFPHNMDFRGRVYPISPHLSHMGDDVNRCILKFAKGRPLGPDGLRWLKLHVINLTGKLKRQSIDERLQAAEKLLPEIIDSAEKPLNGNRWWIDSDDPWQTLAACMELRDALNYKGDPAEFVSHLAVHQDGSCNGLQHYAALGRDRQGGEEVNLLPSELPNDVYSSVAVRVEQKRVEDEQSADNTIRELALKLREALPQEVPRKVIKQTVMTTVYGVTMYGAVLQIKRQLKALGIDGDDVSRFASYLAQKTFFSLNDAFTSSMQLKDWFRECAKGVGELYRTTEWVTPLGLPVVQPYLRVVEKKGKMVLIPITMKQVDAFPPNLVHSLDSTHMMLTSLECSRRGVTFAAVHDCFWTHASTVDEMNEICREQFVKLHSQPLVQQCGEDLRSRYLPKGVKDRMKEEEKEYYTKLFTPQVQPGKLDIEQVRDSVYFFS